MTTGVQFTATLTANQSVDFFTYGWPAEQDVTWLIVPTTVQPGAAHVQWSVATERDADDTITYWITVQNLTGDTFDIEGRFAILNG
jgi:hypothetical protein